MNTPSHPSEDFGPVPIHSSAGVCTGVIFSDQVQQSLDKIVEQRIKREATAAARICADVNDACPYPFQTEEGKLFKKHFLNARGSMAVTSIAVKAHDLTDLPGAVITGYYRNTSAPRGGEPDGQMHAYGRYDSGYFICDQLGWSAFPDFGEIARALNAAADAGGAL